MYRQLSPEQQGKLHVSIKKVHCEKSGTIYYTDGTIRRWSHKAVLKSLEQREKNVFQLAIQNK